MKVLHEDIMKLKQTYHQLLLYTLNKLVLSYMIYPN